MPRMRPFLCLLSLLLVAACAGERERPISRPVNAQFASQALSEDRVEVTAIDRQAMESAELVAPDGTAIAAYQIDRNRTVVDGDGPRPSVGVGVFGGSSGHIGTSVGIGFPLFGADDPDEPVIDSRALIRVPDMAAYRAVWQTYRVRLRFGPPENERVMELPAPRPPEG